MSIHWGRYSGASQYHFPDKHPVGDHHAAPTAAAKAIDTFRANGILCLYRNFFEKNESRGTFDGQRWYLDNLKEAQ
jgi:hypothetical protein